MKKTIVIAEDEQLQRFYLKRDIEKERAEQYQVIGEAANGIELLRLWKQLSPDIIIADLKMPVLTGGEAIKEIRRVDTEVKIIVLTSREEKYSFDALFPLVDAYLIKTKEKPEGILTKIDEVAGLSLNQRRDYVISMLTTEVTTASKLKRQIIEKIRDGAANKNIAEDLKISLKYVERLITELFKEYNVKTRVELLLKLNETI